MIHPYILKKQIVIFIVCIFILSISLLCDLNIKIIYIELLYLAQIVTLICIPILREHIRYSWILHAILINVPTIIGLMFIDINIENKNDILGIISGVSIVFILNLFRKKDKNKYIKENNLITYLKTDNRKFILQIYFDSFNMICEELFFRYILIGYLYDELGIYSVLISTILFVLAHYIVRYSELTYTMKSYIYQFIIGLTFGLVYCYTKSLIGCLIAHFMFNIGSFSILIKRYKNRNKIESYSFDDY